MIDIRTVEVRSIEGLIAALRPIQAQRLSSELLPTTLTELRAMRSNVSAVLSFTSFSLRDELAENPEYKKLIDDVRRECLMINGMVSRLIFRERWLFSVCKVEDACEVLAHYDDMARAVCRLCRLNAPELDNNLLSAF